ncbi:MFS general substrate transporter [Trametes versicolor FP-101664 SS1]|uniref:MFS general substrate transporter n=1 Tax=Trametes versicolor (strain FP-101664) TaxID=717944 RepID=UPI0004621532|nr:MFS general substrate transporter [Trametes versicolor FP-101664 SS1]EIW63711.1 MFS general substrate transporter [Trametes versicolor FP-101664 SS1]
MGPDDPDNPKTWSRPYRWYVTMLSAVLVLNATFASSAPSGIVPQLMAKFSFGTEVATLTIALFVAGYCVGPLLWGPLSEQYGRKPVFLISFTAYTGFQVGCALSQNTASILIFRFLGGVFAAAPLANSGAVMSDVWDADTRGKAMALFALAPFAGPTIGPTVSGFMAVAGVSWRWVFWLLTMFAGTCLVLVIFTLPETYAPAILVKRAQRLRKETGDDRYWAPLERNTMTWAQRTKHVLGRPFIILFREPMLLVITLYMSFIYGVVYLLFEAYPIVFTRGHHFNAGISGLMFLPIFLGAVCAVITYLLIFNPRYHRAMADFAPHPVPPEYRMEVCMYAAPIYTISFFWFGWTSYPSVSYWAPLMAGFPMGFAIIWLFLGLFNYTIDAYLFVAASALSSMTVVRSLFGAGFPLFATQMYETLNPRWASTLLGCLALIMTPIPFVLRRYGHKLRRRSKYSPTGNLPHKPPRKEAEKAAKEAEV